jgi:putative transcription factor
MSYCELCGAQTLEKKMVVVDGTVFNVCVACSKHGKPYVPQQVTAKKKKKLPLAPKAGKKIGLADETILTPNFARLIREARMKMGLTHEQLGMKMNEKAQLLKKFETGTLKPDEILARKLERYLGVKLYVTADKDEE